MKYEFALPVSLLGGGTSEAKFSAETPAENDFEPDQPDARAFVDRCLAVARHVVEQLEKRT